MKFATILLTVVTVIFFNYALAGNISSFHVQLELTPEAKAFVETLSDENKSNWLEFIPDSIPLKATCVLKFKTPPSNNVHFKIGTLDGLNDIYEGSFDLMGKIDGRKSSGEIHYFNIGNITKYKKITALAWISNENGVPVEMIKFEK